MLSRPVAELPEGCEERCPACKHRGLSADESESQKLAWLRRALAPWAETIAPVRGAAAGARLGYRRKVCLHAEFRDGAWAFGLRRALEGRRESEVIGIPRCPVHAPEVRARLAELEQLPADLPLKFVLISGDFVTLVLKTATLPAMPWLDDVWSRLPGVAGLFANLNPAAGFRVVAHKGWHLLKGQSEFEENGLFYGPESFMQLIPPLHHASMSEAVAHIAPQEGEMVLDLYSGLGASLKLWKSRGVPALGVELGGEMVRLLEKNVGPDACLRGRVSDRLPQLKDWVAAQGKVPLVYANPPRTGLEPEVAAWLARELRPARVAYLSCSAGTLARDLAVFADAGYATVRITPYDFFPNTHHVETLALLAR